MNYVKHSMAAHERLRARPDARPHHISLYWALFFAWNAARFPNELPLDHQAAMQAARIGNKHTYRAALYDLAAWGLLTYRPSQSRYDTSRCYLTDLSGPLPAPMQAGTGATSAPHETAAPGPEVAPALGPEVPPMNGSCGPEVAQDTLLGKTKEVNSSGVNGGRAAATQKKEREVFAGEGQSEAQVLDDELTGNPFGADAAPRKPKEKGVGERPPPPHEPRSRRLAPLPELPFRQSPLFNLAAFTAAFAGTDYALADLPHYHQLIDNWRDKKTGLPPTRRDWAATARRFLLNDAHDNRLKLAPGTHHAPNPGAGAAVPNPGARPAGSGYRSKYDA